MYRVLLVDDEELERKIICFILQSSGLPITMVGEATNGREALEKVHLTRPDLIIMDIKMPGIDGIEATRHIKELYPITEVIILTAYGKFSYSQQAIRAQATDYLLKPIQPQQLIEAIKKAIDRLSLKKFQPSPALDLTGLEEQIRAGNLKESKHQLGIILELLEHLSTVDQIPQTVLLNSFALRLMIIVIQVTLSAGADPAEVTTIENELAQDLSHVSSLEDVKSWAEIMLEKCIGILGSNQPFNQSQVLVRKAIDYIESSYANNISLNTIAAHVHLSPAYLSRIFNKQTGRGLTDYLAQVRLKNAKQQLRRSTATIDQIAAATGFNSSSYFSAVFKKHEGITPSEYRANHSL